MVISRSILEGGGGGEGYLRVLYCYSGSHILLFVVPIHRFPHPGYVPVQLSSIFTCSPIRMLGHTVVYITTT